ncbi:DNA-directed RNA polymerase I subunit RPA2 [Halocaridina rubra]|uniref:DNA-directed RNA polymerase subunit beta n=1 Tax=Halocaridina rubra TaxID=373956 RepID=A0AAN9A584_HALRR
MGTKSNSVELSLRHLSNKKFGKIPESPNVAVTELAAPHVESFNFMLGEGLDALLADFNAVEFSLKTTGNPDVRFSLIIRDITIGKPQIPAQVDALDKKVYPKECIERGCSYVAPLTVSLECIYNGHELMPITQNLGDIPLIVKSKNCHLHGLSPKELVKHGELVNETGGYFIINGGSRILRMLTANRRNYPICMNRESWKKRLDHVTEKGVLIRCIAADQTHSMNVLHYLSTGEAKFQFILKQQAFFVPLIMVLKALVNFTDHQIYLYLLRGRESDKYFREKIKGMMRNLQEEGLYNQQMCRNYIGRSFRHKLSDVFPDWFTDEELCYHLLKRCVLVHAETDTQKFESLCFMARKLYAFIANEVQEESPDVVSLQEVTLGGHLYLQYLKELLTDYLISIKMNILQASRKHGPEWLFSDKDLKKFSSSARKIGNTLVNFIATGSLKSKTGCGLMQVTGLTVVLEHLNRVRDLAHLRSIHRGSYFMSLKTIEPRRLTGEAWGFICPVHTPDGAPCGLLNHLAQDCIVVNEVYHDSKKFLQILARLGMTANSCPPLVPYEECLEVMLDGLLVGYIQISEVDDFAEKLRHLKIQGAIFKYTEIVLIKKNKYGGQYPGLFLVTTVARMMRPVINLALNAVEYIGTLEQIYLNIAVTPEDLEEGVHTHIERNKTTIFSNVGKLVPFSDCNPNPRNMYQCQMMKQTMGLPFHNWMSQTASKIYRLQYPQVPLVRNSHYDDMNNEDFCMGFNAVVAICSYTGYDMEDAMVLNKCAMERGLAHGQIYKSEFIDLTLNKPVTSTGPISFFRRNPTMTNLNNYLDPYGLPYPGTKLTNGDPYYCVYNIQTQEYRLLKYKGEDCVVDKYTIMGPSTVKQDFQRVNITIRIARNPIIGDKFASRSGQKGIMSRLYPTEDLPFSERGIIPDIIFNPHGIPSRMTAGKLIELLAGKAAAEFGTSFNSMPFQFSDEDPAVDYFGKILEKGGFNYYGEDTLYSGTDGRMMEVKIFEGLIYYQRLRHMTADKWQVRQTGAVDMITRQPVKGRKKGGAIRFGEMERDCLISHGSSYTLQDRLLNCSDTYKEWVCEECNESLSPIVKLPEGSHHIRTKPVCSLCGPTATLRQVTMPYAFKYLVAELASIGISTKFGLQTAEKSSTSRPKVLANGDV